MLELGTDHRQAIQAHAESTYPHECCGLLLGLASEHISEHIVVEVWATANIWSAESAKLFQIEPSSTTARHFAIAPEDMLRAQRYGRDRGLQTIGIYHSHPDCPATPSELDRTFAWPQYSYMIVSVLNGLSQDVQCWMLDNNHTFQPEAIVVVEPVNHQAIAPLANFDSLPLLDSHAQS